MKIILYKTPTCPKCRVLCAKLNQAGIPYDVCMDIDSMEKMGILSVPVLEVDGARYDFRSAVEWLNGVNK